jgi:hypothetical protein
MWRMDRGAVSSIASMYLRATRETTNFLNVRNAEPVSRDPRQPGGYTYPAIGVNTFLYAYLVQGPAFAGKQAKVDGKQQYLS